MNHNIVGCNEGLFGETYGKQRICQLINAKTADLPDCCMGVGDGLKCGVDCPESARCKDWLKGHCVGDKLFTSNKCGDFCRTNPGMCMNSMQKACVGDRLESEECQSWGKSYPELYRQNMVAHCTGNNLAGTHCQTYAKTHTGFDASVADFCADHPDSDFCACSVPALAKIAETNDHVRILKAKPQCYMTKCAGSGYKFTSQRNNIGGCKPLCLQSISAVGSGNLLQNNALVQNCSGVQLPPEYSAGGAAPLAITLPDKKEKPFDFFWVLVFVLVISLGIFVYSVAHESADARKTLR